MLVYTDAQEKLFLDGPGSDLEFTIVRPGGLSNEPPNGIVNVIKGVCIIPYASADGGQRTTAANSIASMDACAYS